MKYGIPGERAIDAPLDEMAVLLSALKPYVRQSGDSWRKRWTMHDRKLLDYLLVFIAEGDGLFRVAGESFEVKDNDLVWIPPDTVHFMQGVSQDFHCLYVHFDLIYEPRRSHWDACIPEGVLDLSEFADIMHPKMGIPVIEELCGLIRGCNAPVVQGLLSEICIEHERSINRSMMTLSGLMLQLVEQIVRTKLTAGVTQKDRVTVQKLEQAASYIQEHAGEDLNVARVAKRFSFSESHFRKVFKAFHGCSPKKVHCRARIRKASEMLIYSDLTISEIAETLGFCNVHNFSRAFRDLTSLSPSEFRKGVVV